MDHLSRNRLAHDRDCGAANTDMIRRFPRVLSPLRCYPSPKKAYSITGNCSLPASTPTIYHTSAEESKNEQTNCEQAPVSRTDSTRAFNEDSLSSRLWIGCPRTPLQTIEITAPGSSTALHVQLTAHPKCEAADDASTVDSKLINTRTVLAAHSDTTSNVPIPPRLPSASAGVRSSEEISSSPHKKGSRTHCLRFKLRAAPVPNPKETEHNGCCKT